MASVFYEMHPKTQAQIRLVVLLLDRGEQPPRDMDVMAAVDYEYAEYEQIGEKPATLWLTPKGLEAAIRWRHDDDSHGGDVA